MPDTIKLTLTPAEQEELLNALYFYQATLHLNFTGEELECQNSLLDRLESLADEPD